MQAKIIGCAFRWISEVAVVTRTRRQTEKNALSIQAPPPVFETVPQRCHDGRVRGADKASMHAPSAMHPKHTIYVAQLVRALLHQPLRRDRTCVPGKTKQTGSLRTATRTARR